MNHWLLLLAALPLGALAQVDGPALEACRALGERELKKDGTGVQALVIDRDRHLFLEPLTRKLGSQAVSSSLSGNGGIVRKAGPAVELTFVCLLADRRRALLFHWAPRRDAPALAQCRRGAAPPGKCLQLLHDLAERDLVEVAAFRFQESLDADAKAGDDSASSAYRNAAGAWRKYRDVECARRGPGGSEPWRACMVELSRLRYLDLQ